MTLLLAQISGGSGVAYSLTGSAGSYAYTGNTASFKVAYALTGEAGSYSYTGQSATLAYHAGSGTIAYTLNGETGAYSLTGQSATFSYLNKGQVVWGGAGTYKGELDYKYDEEDDEEMIIMALAHQLIEMRVI